MTGDLKLGTVPEVNSPRDAVHVAVLPVQAGEDLHPGQWVNINSVGLAVARHPSQSIGVIDPFRVGLVKRDEWFYLCMRPGTVTSLRHDWEHPSVPPRVESNLHQKAIDELYRAAAALQKDREALEAAKRSIIDDDDGEYGCSC